ncbi:MAG: C1 family peptidase [Bacteroidales bacterium]|jgi:aminopeptidase C|nr:C1 family peptidase [Bacteroidales bacterium]
MKHLKKLFFIALIAIFLAPCFAQETNKEKPEGYILTPTKEIKYTPVKNQNRSGTCWSFSGIGFLECELIRKGRGEFDLSDMWIVKQAYREKADKYVRMHGNWSFAGGGAFFDVFAMIDKFGIMPTEVFKGTEYGEEMHVHGELDALLKAYVDVIIKNPNKRLSTAWKKGYDAIVDAYLGKDPEKFIYAGKEYTPKSFATFLGLNMKDYISITSFTHHPFYTQFALEIPDNWLMETSYNLPLDEMMKVINNAINNGYSVAWGADVSEKGFNWRKGIAVMPEKDVESLDGSDRARWENLSQGEKDDELYKFDKPGKEKKITQEIRQIAFDNYTTTDDHGMVLVGKATDQNGTPYFIVKNSWGVDSRNPYKGFLYASEPFLEMQTINIVVHKDAIPADIKKKLGIN